MESIYFSPEHATFRTTVRNFLKEHIVPNADAWETAQEIPAEAWQILGRNGMLGLMHSKQDGGKDLDLFHSIVFLEELGRIGYGGIRAAISVHAYMSTHYLAKYGSAALRQSYLAPSIVGDKVAALAITEWDAGSDLGRMATSAQQVDDCFVISGTKVFITNGTNANYFIVAVRTSKPEQASARANTGISLIVVDAASPGITVTPQEKLGWHSAGTAEVKFESVKVPSFNVIGRLNSGFMYLMRGFQLERLVAASLALGGVDRCLEITLNHLISRQAFGGALFDLQTIKHRIANMATDLVSARALSYHAAWSYQRNELSVKECSMAKLQATELACRAADECLQLHGGRGYLATSEIARLYRDARGASIAGGTSEVMREIIAQQILETNN